jgi:hypothetical protein
VPFGILLPGSGYRGLVSTGRSDARAVGTAARMRLRAAGILLALGLLGLLAGCGSTGGPGDAGPTASIPDSASASPGDSSDQASDSVSDTVDPSDLVIGSVSSAIVTVPPPTGSAQASTVSSPPAGMLACAPPYLRLTERSVHGGLSHAGYVLLFTNTGQIACWMTGYPRLAILDGRDRQIIQAIPTPRGYLGGLRNPKPPFPAAVLAAGETASALLEGLVVDSRSGKGCPTEHALLSTPPATTSPLKVVAVTTICSQVQIHPVVAGGSGSQP